MTVGARGPASDINLFRQQQAKFSTEQKFVGDKAYVGAARTTTPTKKPKGGELTTEQQEENKRCDPGRFSRPRERAPRQRYLVAESLLNI